MIRVALATLLLTTPALSHDSWINQGGYRNLAGEWCCGEKDCEIMPHGSVHEVTGGYRVEFTRGGIKSEFIPFKEAQPSPDGEFWRCHRADGQRICFFAPPGNS